MKISARLVVISLITLTASTVFANCPDEIEVQYRCDSSNNCAWSGPLYGRWEALTTSPGNKGEHASFTHAFWGTVINPNSPLPNYMGDAICFYLTPEGQLITLIPTHFGVSRIYLGDEWQPSHWEGKNGYTCAASTEACDFLY